MIEFKTSLATKLSEETIHNYALSIIAGGVVLAILYWARTVFITTVVAIILALILEPFVGVLVRLRMPRSLATFFISFVAIVVFYFVGLTAYTQASSLAGDLPQFKERLGAVAQSVTERMQQMEEATTRLLPARKDPLVPVPPAGAPNARKRGKQTTPPVPLPESIQEVRIHKDSNPVADFVLAKLGSVYEFVLMASFVPFLVFFMLSWRDHIYRSFLRFFDGTDRIAAARSLDSISGVARAFVVGNFLIGLTTAVLTAIAFLFMHVPYPLLVGGLSGFLSIVPYAGVPLALTPPLLTAIAGGQPTSALLLIVAVVMLLHMVALNVMYPKLVGARVHLNPLVVTFSIMFWGFLWDAAGLVLAIPLTAGIKAVCDNVVPLRPIGRFLGD